MSKKHYQAIARELHLMIVASKTTEGTPEQTARYCAARIADVLQSFGGAFDRVRFLEACNTGTTKGMSKAFVADLAKGLNA